MTIKGFWKFVESRCKGATSCVDAKAFAGTYIAVDAPTALIECFSYAQRLYLNTIDLVHRPYVREDALTIGYRVMFDTFYLPFLRNGIMPIMVFDGKKRPEKTDTVEKRKTTITDYKNNIKALTEKVDAAKNMSILYSSGVTAHGLGVSVAELRNALASDITLNPEERMGFRKVIESHGFPWLVANHDAEELCAALGRSGIVSAVYGTDGDTVIWGAPVLIREKQRVGWSGMNFTIVRSDIIRRQLKLNSDQIVDLAIGAKCDYNVNVPGFSISRTYTLLMSGKDATHIKDPGGVLKIQRCREIFARHHWSKLIFKGEITFNKQRLFGMITKSMIGVDPKSLRIAERPILSGEGDRHSMAGALGCCKPSYLTRQRPARIARILVQAPDGTYCPLERYVDIRLQVEAIASKEDVAKQPLPITFTGDNEYEKTRMIL